MAEFGIFVFDRFFGGQKVLYNIYLTVLPCCIGDEVVGMFFIDLPIHLQSLKAHTHVPRAKLFQKTLC